MIENDYRQAIARWRKHIRLTIHSSRAGDYIDCEAFETLCQMGKEILPLIFQTMQQGPDSVMFGIHGLEWAALIHRIVPEFEIPENIRGRVQEIYDYTQKFVEAQLIQEKFLASLSMPIDAGRRAIEEAEKTIEKYKHLLDKQEGKDE